MDMAKMIGVLQTNGGAAVEYAGFDLVKNPLPPLIVVPTTSGTGSEVTFCAVVTDNEKRAKIAPVSTYLAPRIALMDPALTCSMPVATTVATGLDAFCHAFESYTCALTNPATEVMAGEAMRLVGRYLDVAVQDGSDLEARGYLQIASTMAGMAFTNSDCCGVHAMSESYGGMVDMPHGIACAVFLAPVFAFNMEADPARHGRVGEFLGLDIGGLSAAEAAALTLDHLVRWQRELGVPRLSEIPGVDPKDFDQAAQGATENLAAGSQPRPTSVEDYRRMFDEAYKA
jgi:alcohol dehydrogenase